MSEQPAIEIVWIKGKDIVEFKGPNTWTSMGRSDSGKSASLETVSEEYLKNGSCVFDAYSSRASESLAWLRNPLIKDKRVLLVHGEKTACKSVWEMKPFSKVGLGDFQDYDLIISPAILYGSPEDEFASLEHMMKQLYYYRHEFTKTLCLIIREAADVLYSRTKLSEAQHPVKKVCTFLIRQARHIGIACLMDSQKWTSVDLDIREKSRYILIKSMGGNRLPKSLSWMYYNYIDPNYLDDFPPQFGILWTHKNKVGFVKVRYPSWHKQPGEGMTRPLNIDIEYLAPPKEGEDRGTFKTLSDADHAALITSYIEGLSMGRVADKFQRSPATVENHIDKHNSFVEASGYCPYCERVNSEYAGQNVSKRRVSVPPLQTGIHLSSY